MREQLGDRLPTFTEYEFTIMREAEVDFYGMNYYTSQYARHRTTPAEDTDYIGNVDELQENKEGVPIGAPSGIHWLYSAPHGFRKHLVRIYEKYGKPIYITENGCPCPNEDKMTLEESVKDPYRQKYFQDHLDAIVGAIQDGAKVDGYFAWSLMDNLGEFSLHQLCRPRPPRY
jgi:beta-glucosidase